MKSPLTTALVLTGALILGSCGPTDDAVTKTNARLEERLNAEREARQQGEIQLRQEKSEKSGWQIAASILFGGAILALIIGTILGSRTRLLEAAHGRLRRRGRVHHGPQNQNHEHERMAAQADRCA